MKKIVFILILVFVGSLQSYAQNTFTFSNGRGITFPGDPLCTYAYPSDTTDQLSTSTHVAISPDSIHYANVLYFKKEVIGLLIVRAAIKDLKRDLYYNIIVVDLDLKKTIKGHVLTFNTSVGHNVFLQEQESKDYPYYSVMGMQLQMVSCSKENADAIVREVNKRLDAIK